jgi:hypothetical protein
MDLELRILNHAAERTTYRMKWNLPAGWTLIESQESVTLAGRKEGTFRARLRAGRAGLHVLTADVSFGGRDLKQWTEALVRVR